MRFNTRQLVLSTIGAGLAAGGIAAATAVAATDDELAFANFGQATELLLADFYRRVDEMKIFSGPPARDVRRSAFNAQEHAVALGRLLTEAGQQAAVAEDFEFVWPEATFRSAETSTKAGLLITENLAGVYISALVSVSVGTYRQLYASMLANLAQQIAFLSHAAGNRTIGVSFPAAVAVETASDAIEGYLG